MFKHPTQKENKIPKMVPVVHSIDGPYQMMDEPGSQAAWPGQGKIAEQESCE